MSSAFDRPTKLLHFALAVGIPIELVLGELMKRPREGRTRTALEAWSFEVHEALGLTLVAIVVAHIVWRLARGGLGELRLQFPWFERERLNALLADVREHLSAALRLSFPPDADRRALPAAAQGLGLLASVALVATGLVMYWGGVGEGRMPLWVRPFKEFHEIVATLMWIYVAAHGVMGLLHRSALRDILPWRR